MGIRRPGFGTGAPDRSGGQRSVNKSYETTGSAKDYLQIAEADRS
jgi:hypothetical protein